MKINKIENMTLDNVAIKKNLSKEEVDRLKDVLKTLVKTYVFFEFDQDFDNDDLFVRDYDLDFPNVSIAGYEEEDGLLMGDYFVRCAFMTEKEQIIIDASPVRPIDGKYLLVDSKLESFLVTDLDNDCTTPALYDCFINDIPAETVTI